jgi:hypothetical protein
MVCGFLVGSDVPAPGRLSQAYLQRIARTTEWTARHPEPASAHPVFHGACGSAWLNSTPTRLSNDPPAVLGVTLTSPGAGARAQGRVLTSITAPRGPQEIATL